MRFRDMRAFIIISFLLLVAFAGLMFVYIIPIKEKQKDEALRQTELLAETHLINANGYLDSYINSFLNQHENDQIVEVDDVLATGVEGKFGNKNYLLCREEEMFEKKFDENGVEIVSPTSADYHFFLYDKVNNKVGMINPDVIFSNYEPDEAYFAFTKDGVIVASNMGMSNSSFYEIIRKSNGELANQIKSQVVLGDSKSLSGTCEIKVDSYITVINNGDYYYAYGVNVNGSSISLDYVKTQSIIFYSSSIVLLVVCFIVLILGFKRAGKLLRIDKRNYKKSKGLVIRIKKNGDVTFINKAVYRTFGTKVKIKNIRQFKAVGDKGIVECYKKELNFIAAIMITNRMFYFNFVSILSGNEYYLIGFDVTKQYINNQLLLSMSSKNPVTKKDNLMKLTSDYLDIVEEAQTNKISFVLLNIIGFREINKVFGRKTGDNILIIFSNLIESVFEGMHVYHVDADQFIVVVKDLEERKAGTLSSNILKQLKTPIIVKNNHIYVKIKMGLYDLDIESTPNIALDEIRSKLDMAMTKAKNTETRDIIAYDSSLENILAEINRMEIDLQSAISKGEFEMKYQPQYDIINNKIVSFEALIRWNNPLYINQSPQVFIELAEQNGFILDIGKFVMEEAFKAAKKFEDYNCHVSINVSPAQIFQAGFVSDLISEFEKNNLKPGSVAIEITETFVMENFNVVIEKLKMLKKKGFSIHLDDFGTGYSSMLYLKDLPIDTIKIDKEFTKTIESDKFSLTMVENICSMGKELNLGIICEGVETQGQSNILKKLGCRIIQGWLIGKAMPIDEAIKAILHYNGQKNKK